MDRIQQLRNKLADAPSDSEERVDILNDLIIEIFVFNLEEAERLAEESAELSRRLNYSPGICTILVNEGAILYNKDEPEAAKACLQKALIDCEAHDFLKGQAMAIFLLALIEWSFGHIEIGFEHAQKALKLAHKVGDHFMEGWANAILGGFYYDVGDNKNSLQHFEKAVSIFQELHSIEGLARALNGIGNNHLLTGNPQKALQYQQQCLKTLRGSGIQQVEARALLDLANICKQLGDHQDAVNYYRESLAMRRAIGHVTGEVTTLLSLSELLIQMKEIEEGRELSEEALRLAIQINARPKICKAHQNLSLIFASKGDFETALTHYKKFHELEKDIYHEAADKKLKHLEAIHQAEKSTKETEIYKLRNVDLKNKNQELKRLLNQLRTTQTQLINSEKMATLGKLVAGIAHEINNPIGVVSSTNQVTERCVEKIEAAVNNSAAQNELNESESYLKAIRILKRNTNLITDAADRINAISKSLKKFVRLDEAEIQKIDIHDEVENTLALLSHQLHQGISVVKEYGQLPEIYCFPGELNQVFMSLLSNAINAISSKGTIRIKTFLKNGKANIQISDTGSGIPRNKIKRLFEFDFSQSGARIKMSTGLVTANSIMGKHKGAITVKSKVGEGSTFTIALPTDLHYQTA